MDAVDWSLGKYDVTKQLYERAIQSGETVPGPFHPKVTSGLNKLAVSLQSQVGC